MQNSTTSAVAIWTRRHILPVTVVVAAGCTDATAPAVPVAIEAARGNGQTAVAGTAVSSTPAVRVLDERGRPVSGVQVTFSVVEGAGSVANTNVRTARDGSADAGAWTLGTTAGTNVLVAETAGLNPVEFTASGVPGSAARIEVASGDVQTGGAGDELASMVVVRVTDVHGNGVAGSAVRFESQPGSGSAVRQEVLTDDSGTAGSGWRLGTGVGEQKLRAAVPTVGEVTFSASCVAGQPAILDLLGGDEQTAIVNTAVALPLSVRALDRYGNRAIDVQVQFAIESGDGLVGQDNGGFAMIATDSSGIAHLPRWTLGVRAGVNRVRVSAGTALATFTATGLPAAPATILKIEGDGVTAAPGLKVGTPPAVRVVDAHQNGVEGVRVTFTVTSGGGSIADAESVTNVEGIAAVGSWTLGPATGTNTVLAESAGLAAAVFMATAANGAGQPGNPGPTGPFDMDVRVSGSAAGSYQNALAGGATAWSRVIVGDLPDVPVSIPANGCGINHVPINENVDDLLILIEVASIDGPGNIVGTAGPCYVRSNSGLPVVGAMRIDVADISTLLGMGRLEDVVAHEVGHIIGIGTLWSDNVIGAGGPDPYHAGPATRAGFQNIGGTSYPGIPVPIENTGGSGTRDSHWRKAVLSGELMTGWLTQSGGKISEVTVGALADIGYHVDATGADAFGVSSGQAAIDGVSEQPQMTPIVERPLDIRPVVVDARGRPLDTTRIVR